MRLLLVEALLLAGIGALAGLVFARWASPLLVAQLSTSVTRVMLDLSLDWRVLAFTIAVTGVTAVLFGTAPAFRATRVAPIDALKEQGRGALGDARTSGQRPRGSPGGVVDGAHRGGGPLGGDVRTARDAAAWVR